MISPKIRNFIFIHNTIIFIIIFITSFFWSSSCVRNGIKKNISTYHNNKYINYSLSLASMTSVSLTLPNLILFSSDDINGFFINNLFPCIQVAKYWADNTPRKSLITTMHWVCSENSEKELELDSEDKSLHRMSLLIRSNAFLYENWKIKNTHCGFKIGLFGFH